jgi:hypothetical protein
MTALTVGQTLVDVLGYGVAVLVALFFLWIVLAKLRFPPVVKALAGLRAKRTRRNQRIAQSLGMQFSNNDQFGLLDMPLTMMSFGTHRWINSVIYGSYRGRDVWLFRLYFQVPGGRYGPSLMTHRGAVARIEAAFPHVLVYRHTLFSGGEDLRGAEEVTFDKEFDDEYHVQATDPELATELLDANVRRWLLDLDKHWRFEISGPWVLAYRYGRSEKADPHEMLEVVSDFADRLPWILLQQHPAGSEPDPDPLRVGPPPLTDRQRRNQKRWSRVIVAASALFIGGILAAGAVGAYQNSRDHCEEACAGPTVSIPEPSVDVPTFVPSAIVLPSPSPTPTPTLTASPQRAIVLQGTLPGQQVTVTFLGMVVAPNPTAPPGTPPARQTVGAHFDIRNTGTRRYTDFPANGIRLLDASGRRFTPQILDTFSPGYRTIHLDPGEHVRGFVTFRIPGTSRPVAVLFRTNSGFGPQTGRWDLR